MNQLPNELIGLILSYSGHYAPIVRLVCKQWRSNLKHQPVSIQLFLQDKRLIHYLHKFHYGKWSNRIIMEMIRYCPTLLQELCISVDHYKVLEGNHFIDDHIILALYRLDNTPSTKWKDIIPIVVTFTVIAYLYICLVNFLKNLTEGLP